MTPDSQFSDLSENDEGWQCPFMMWKTIKEEQVLGKVMSTDLDMLSLIPINCPNKELDVWV